MAEKGGKNILRKTVHLDFQKMLDIVGVGVRRASAFLKIGKSHKTADEIGDFSVGGGMTFQFWPKEIDVKDRQAAVDEFDHWLLGNCLRELDHFFSLFLDRCWFAVEAIEVAGKRLPVDYEFDSKFANKTNVGSKHTEVARRVGASTDKKIFRSLSCARNSLTHGAGVVRERDCNEDGLLRLFWIAPVVLIRDGDKIHKIREYVLDTQELKIEKGAQIEISFQEISKDFPQGSQIQLSEQEIAEICFFYHSRASILIKMIQELAK